MRDVLRDRRALLVLDNLEHLLQAGPLLPALLSACSDLAILVTSRSVLRLSGEHAVAVPPLSLSPARPAPAGERGSAPRRLNSSSRGDGCAEPLPPHRGRRARPSWPSAPGWMGCPGDWTGGCARAFAAAGGAVARARVRLVLLTGGGRDQPARLRSMRDAIEGPPTCCRPRSGRCSGGSRSSSGASRWRGPNRSADRRHRGNGLAPPTPPSSMASLARDDSLVRQEAGSGGGSDDAEGTPGAPRYLMLETVREYGLELSAASGEADDVRRRHADYVLGLVEWAAPHLWGHDQWVGAGPPRRRARQPAGGAGLEPNRGPLGGTRGAIGAGPLLVLYVHGPWRRGDAGSRRCSPRRPRPGHPLAVGAGPGTPGAGTGLRPGRSRPGHDLARRGADPGPRGRRPPRPVRVAAFLGFTARDRGEPPPGGGALRGGIGGRAGKRLLRGIGYSIPPEHRGKRTGRPGGAGRPRRGEPAGLGSRGSGSASPTPSRPSAWSPWSGATATAPGSRSTSA